MYTKTRPAKIKNNRRHSTKKEGSAARLETLRRREVRKIKSGVL